MSTSRRRRLRGPADHHQHRPHLQRSSRTSLSPLAHWHRFTLDSVCFLPVVQLDWSLSGPRAERLVSQHLPQDHQDLLEVLVQNSSRDSRTLRARLETLHTQVLLYPSTLTR